MLEQNPLYHSLFPATLTAESEENIPDHCRPLSPDRDGLDSSSEQLSPGGAPEGSLGDLTDGELATESPAFTEGGQQEPSAMSGNGQVNGEQQYTSESSTGALTSGSVRAFQRNTG